MRDEPLPEAFHWYSEAAPNACPPRSLFVLLLVVSVLAAIPAAGLWYLGNYPATAWLGVLGLFLLAALLIDVLSTYKRYRLWAREWLCASCRSVLLMQCEADELYALQVVTD
jgi:hypothetical protein